MLPVCAWTNGDHMKKSAIKITAAVIALFCMCLSVFGAYADMILVYDGYSYSIFNNTSISLEGWDNRTSDLVIPETIGGRYFISVANNGLRNNTFITSVDFSQTSRLRRIGVSAFQGCTGINQPVVLPESLTQMNDSAFQECTALPAVTVNAALTVIPEQAFYGCSSMTTVNFSEGLQTIGRIAFANCTALEYVNIPRSVTEINTTAFYNDQNLTLGVWYGSYGYEFAKAQNISYVLLDGVKLGDANGDGNININDVTAIQRHLAELGTLEGIYRYAADSNQDSVLNISDATHLQSYLAEYIVENPIGEVLTT